MYVHDWLNIVEFEEAEVDSTYIEIRFKAGRREVYLNSNSLDLAIGDPVIVEADRGIDYGMVNLTGEMVRLRMRAGGKDSTDAWPAILRKATLEDIEHAEGAAEREADAFATIRAGIDQHRLPMSVVDVEWQFDGNKVTAYFTAEKRVDFRKLVRDLASKLKTRIELRQIGARDAAARIGGIGVCGRELCCSTWIQEFKPVSTQAAKTQGLPLNPVRLSGLCGRLKCCLNYELEQYMEALARFPEVGSSVETSDGRARVTKVDIFSDQVGLLLPSGDHIYQQLKDLNLEPREKRSPRKKARGSETSERKAPQRKKTGDRRKKNS